MDKERRFSCPYEGCTRSFTKASNLTQHIRIHSGEKPFMCKVCSRQFRQSGNLTKHLKSHENAHLRWNRATEDKPFKCPYIQCGKSFTAKSSLVSHVRHHNESDPQFSFAASISPTLGAQSDDEVRPPKSVVIYRCKHLGCISTFPSTSQLREHALKCSAAAVSFEFDFMLDKLRSFVTQTEELVHSHPHVAELISNRVKMDDVRLFLQTVTGSTHPPPSPQDLATAWCKQSDLALNKDGLPAVKREVVVTGVREIRGRGGGGGGRGVPSVVRRAEADEEEEEEDEEEEEEKEEEGEKVKDAVIEESAAAVISGSSLLGLVDPTLQMSLRDACGYFDTMFDDDEVVLLDPDNLPLKHPPNLCGLVHPGMEVEISPLELASSSSSLASLLSPPPPLSTSPLVVEKDDLDSGLFSCAWPQLMQDFVHADTLGAEIEAVKRRKMDM